MTGKGLCGDIEQGTKYLELKLINKNDLLPPKNFDVAESQLRGIAVKRLKKVA